jgi:hypothetical protein
MLGWSPTPEKSLKGPARQGPFFFGRLSRRRAALLFHGQVRKLVCHSAISYRLAGASSLNIEESPMVRAVAAFSVTILCGLLLVSFGAEAATNSNADALKKATADCRAQVKDYAKYNETSWYGRRKMVKKCVKGMPWRKN